ncbi:hypothetical protein EXN61_01655 [Agrobacterium tumefaciens]|uniref:Uncharacterized protein n=1 Tax=Agrobacterium tumefaciens TaxID=358 RepID=A0A546Y6Q1_AGRTU|nr:hypothetical protein [Agrobacterium tumefaciens]TRB08662.1 hypothetical protein EXN61_01655 [Agrobacterium tumefaciens]
MTENDKQRQLAVTIAKQVSRSEGDEIREWAAKLLEIRGESISAPMKAKKALTLTAKSKVVLPALKIIAKQSKKYGWDNRSAAQRIGMGAAAVGITVFGGSNAGIAALGGAVGVPLWMVLGGGAMFAKYLIDEITQKDTSGATYTVIDADKED